MIWVMIFIWLVVIWFCLIHRADEKQWIKARAEPAAVEPPTPPVSEFLTAWDELLSATSHDAVLARLPDSVREDFELANRPCPKVRSGVHTWIDHTAIVSSLTGEHLFGCWRCACGAHTKNAELVMLDEVSTPDY